MPDNVKLLGKHVTKYEDQKLGGNLQEVLIYPLSTECMSQPEGRSLVLDPRAAIPGPASQRHLHYGQGLEVLALQL